MSLAKNMISQVLEKALRPMSKIEIIFYSLKRLDISFIIIYRLC